MKIIEKTSIFFIKIIKFFEEQQKNPSEKIAEKNKTPRNSEPLLPPSTTSGISKKNK